MKTTAWILFGALVLHSLVLVTPVTAGPQSKDSQRIARLKLDVTKYRDKGREMTVELRTGKKLKGYVSEINADSFTLRDAKTGPTSAIAYSEVSQIKGKGLSTLAKIGIGWLALGLIVTLVGGNR